VPGPRAPLDELPKHLLRVRGVVNIMEGDQQWIVAERGRDLLACDIANVERARLQYHLVRKDQPIAAAFDVLGEHTVTGNRLTEPRFRHEEIDRAARRRQYLVHLARHPGASIVWQFEDLDARFR
jgi:hypothetical protein